jgi:hypothetical protein
VSVSRLFSTRKKMSQRSKISLARRRFGSFFAPRKSRSSIHPSIRSTPGQPNSLQKSKQNFFFASETRERETSFLRRLSCDLLVNSYH